ncbi:hypothetical protein [Francisella-like endosymbiont]|uniref:hypothetical protein n=1 Tax=Francisella-like endosymbiont TaxID=512373 RepID=UPI00296E496D
MWSTAFIGIRYLMLNGFSAGGPRSRYSVASIVMLIIFIKQKPKTIPRPNDLLRFAILGFGIVILCTLIILFSKGNTAFEFIGICLVYGACFSGAIYSFFKKVYLSSFIQLSQ